MSDDDEQNEAQTTPRTIPTGYHASHMLTSASRDIHSIHPYTNLKLHETQGPLVITEGDGVFVRDENGKTYLEALVGLVVRQPGILRAPSGRGRLSPDAQAALLSHLRSQGARCRH